MSRKKITWALVYITGSLLTYYIFYFAPLTLLGNFSTPIQNPLYTDSNFYEDIVNRIYRSGGNDWILIGTTWWSWGVIGFGVISKFVLGGLTHSSIAGNIALNLTAISLLVKSGFTRKHVYLAFLMPFYFSYGVMLSKEVLSVFAFSVMIYALSKQSVKVLVLGLLIALVTRLVLFVGMILILVHLRLTRTRIFRYLGFVSIVILVAACIQYTGDLEYRAESSTEALLLTLVGPVDSLRTVLMAIPRVTIWTLSPLPLINFSKVGDIFSNDPYLFWQAFLYISRVLSSLLILAMLVVELVRYFTKKTLRIDVYVLGLLVLFSSLAFFEGARYRSILEPFLALRFLTSYVHAKGIFTRGFR